MDFAITFIQIIHDKAKAGPGIALSTPCYSPEDIFSWHDLSKSINYATLKAACFPPGAFLVPGIVPPGTVPPYPASPAVFLARASLVEGGLILCVAVHHTVTDIMGFGALLKIWAAHCRDGSSGDIGFNANWMDRVPLFSSSLSARLSNSSNPTSMPDLLHIATPEKAPPSTARSQAERGAASVQKRYQTGIFYFPQKQLRALKDAVNKYIASTEPGSWVSTNDILSSLLWSSMIEAGERSSLPNPGEVAVDEDTRASILSFPVQFRSVLRPPFPQEFLGAAFLMTNAQVLHKDICLISRSMTGSKPTTQEQEGEKELSPEDYHLLELRTLSEVPRRKSTTTPCARY
ncbi:hypothetical protein ONZ43_g7821 [Nemania bipapillata]|uniref:Uncharacterized protein n=1 Tax=Nemania bipapillata TaxID=110536 RepID=A0ACC2HN56_9PEZI|nr:hypothetical protein ONZ43_g7821 [Nemania bipapillata]